MSNKDDERLRKTTIAFLKEFADKGYENAVECIDWLEKQGEHRLYVNDNAKEMFIKALERVEEQNNKGYKLTDCDKNSLWEDFKNYTSCTIEQKPILDFKAKNWYVSKVDGKIHNIYDKVEPKFKVGDWVKISTTNGDRVVQIASVEYLKDGQPCYFTTEGRCFGNGTKARLLTDKDVETITLSESKIVVNKIKSQSEDDVRRRSTIQVLEYARSLDVYNQYGKADIDKNIAWLEKL